MLCMVRALHSISHFNPTISTWDRADKRLTEGTDLPKLMKQYERYR